jgi:hypothetical protein
MPLPGMRPCCSRGDRVVDPIFWSPAKRHDSLAAAVASGSPAEEAWVGARILAARDIGEAGRGFRVD